MAVTSISRRNGAISRVLASHQAADYHVHELALVACNAEPLSPLMAVNGEATLLAEMVNHSSATVAGQQTTYRRNVTCSLDLTTS